MRAFFVFPIPLRTCRKQQQENSGSREARRQKFEIPEAAPIYSIRLNSKSQEPNVSSLTAALRSGKKSTKVRRRSASFPKTIRMLALCTHVEKRDIYHLSALVNKSLDHDT